MMLINNIIYKWDDYEYVSHYDNDDKAHVILKFNNSYLLPVVKKDLLEGHSEFLLKHIWASNIRNEEICDVLNTFSVTEIKEMIFTFDESFRDPVNYIYESSDSPEPGKFCFIYRHVFNEHIKIEVPVPTVFRERRNKISKKEVFVCGPLNTFSPKEISKITFLEDTSDIEDEVEVTFFPDSPDLHDPSVEFWLKKTLQTYNRDQLVIDMVKNSILVKEVNH